MATIYTIDYGRLFDSLGGTTQVSYLLGKMGLPVAARTPDKWRERGSVDGLYLAALLAHEALAGRPIDLNKFLIPLPREVVRRPRAALAGRPGRSRTKPKHGQQF